MENITYMSQIIQDAVFKPFIGEQLPHVLNHIINYWQVEFGLQLFTDTVSQRLGSWLWFIPTCLSMFS